MILVLVSLVAFVGLGVPAAAADAAEAPRGSRGAKRRGSRGWWPRAGVGGVATGEASGGNLGFLFQVFRWFSGFLGSV